MKETRIALAFVALGIALLVGTFAYLAFDREDSRSAGTPAARGAATSASVEQEQRRSGARTGADGPETAGAASRSVQTSGDEPAPSGDAAPSAEEQTTLPQPAAAGQDGANVSVARGAVPAYDAPLRESEADGVTEVVVGTEARGEDEMRLVASDLASDYPPGDGVLLVEFREGANVGAAAGRETGFALVFGSKEAAMAPDLEYTEEEVDEIFEEDGGVRAVSYEEFSQENPALKDDLERIRAS